jgi:hypothetical protein
MASTLKPGADFAVDWPKANNADRQTQAKTTLDVRMMTSPR